MQCEAITTINGPAGIVRCEKETHHALEHVASTGDGNTVHWRTAVSGDPSQCTCEECRAIEEEKSRQLPPSICRAAYDDLRTLTKVRCDLPDGHPGRHRSTLSVSQGRVASWDKQVVKPKKRTQPW
ncbi:hypothetical protein SEA_DALANDE_7 [Gordonia phage DalanDe]|nr:hypothetical protein SEA_DALANDE_7 [Gordonia phage DalanDe]